MVEVAFPLVLYGIIMWAVVFATLLCLTATGVRASFGALLGLTTVGSTAARELTAQDWDTAALRAGVPRERIDDPAQVSRSSHVRAAKGISFVFLLIGSVSVR